MLLCTSNMYVSIDDCKMQEIKERSRIFRQRFRKLYAFVRLCKFKRPSFLRTRENKKRERRLER